jgi:hypothetical protein
MFSAISWGIKSDVIIGERFPVCFLPFLAILFYPFLFTTVFLFLETPVKIYQMKNHHAGGLLGYSEEYKAQVYDPSRNAYIAYDHLYPPSAASKFTEAFKVVLFYKFRPAAKYYRDTKSLSISSQLTTLLVAAMGLVMVYISLYILAKAYIAENGLQIQLSHQSLAVKFHGITGIPPLNALLIALFIYVFVLGAGIISVKKIINHFKSLYASDQQTLKGKLLNSVSPMETITGRVIGRHYKTESRSHSEGAGDDTGHSVGRGGKTIYYTVDIFTVEFRDIIQIPVYLNVTTRPSKNAREDEEMLNSLFSDEWEDIPKEMPELDFIINPDYSISLKDNKNR